MRSHLQERHLMRFSLLKRRSGFCVYAENRVRQQKVYRLFCFALAHHHYCFAGKDNRGECSNRFFIEFIIDDFSHYSACDNVMQN